MTIVIPDSLTPTQYLRTLRGKPYILVLKQIRDTIEPEARTAFTALKARNGSFTVTHLGILAIQFDLPLKSMAECLEDYNLVPCGAYDRMADMRGFKAGTVLQWAREAIERESTLVAPAPHSTPQRRFRDAA